MSVDTNRDAELFEIVLELMKILKRYTSRVAEQYGLSMPQVQLLWTLGSGGPVSMGTVAEEMSCDPSNVTGIVHRLEEAQLIERSADPRDRRIKTLTMTDKGERVRKELTERVSRELPIANGLSESERTTLQNLLLKAVSSTQL